MCAHGSVCINNNTYRICRWRSLRQPHLHHPHRHTLRPRAIRRVKDGQDGLNMSGLWNSNSSAPPASCLLIVLSSCSSVLEEVTRSDELWWQSSSWSSSSLWTCRLFNPPRTGGRCGACTAPLTLLQWDTKTVTVSSRFVYWLESPIELTVGFLPPLTVVFCVRVWSWTEISSLKFASKKNENRLSPCSF